ncbi:DUF4097 family beta strand repeat-containing protein [Streptomyces sp. NPDC096030]|uniref:DUF4097 family beta strand repeat-containing protein n=1 Tax=Streptomyces sp. NPDC096030 TaxID=3155423 RepID=UPI00332E037B
MKTKAAAAAGICLCAAAGLAAGCGSTGQKTLEQSYEIGEISQLTVQEAAGDVTISAADGPVTVKETMHFTGTEPETSHDVTDEALTLDSGCDGKACSVDYTIRVPAGTALTVETGTGDITVTGSAGKLDLDASAGDIRAEDLTSPEARMESSAGTISALFTRPPRTAEASTVAGDIAFYVPPGTSYAAGLTTQSGDTSLDVPVSPGSPNRITLHTDNGTASLQPAP